MYYLYNFHKLTFLVSFNERFTGATAKTTKKITKAKQFNLLEAYALLTRFEFHETLGFCLLPAGMVAETLTKTLPRATWQPFPSTDIPKYKDLELLVKSKDGKIYESDCKWNRQYKCYQCDQFGNDLDSYIKISDLNLLPTAT